MTPEIQSLRKSHQLAFVTLAEHFEALEAGADEYPLAAALDTGATGKHVAAVLHPQPGWTWDTVRIVAASGGRLLFSCEGLPALFTVTVANPDSKNRNPLHARFWRKSNHFPSH